MATILFIDDEPLTLKLLSQAATILGHQAFATAKPNEAISIAETHQPDLIVTDIHLDGCDDLEFVDRLHQNPKTGSIPIVTLSALQPIQAEEVSRSHGAVASLSKPVRLQTLLDVIGEHAHSQSRPLQPVAVPVSV